MNNGEQLFGFGICNDTIVGYIKQSLRFEHSLIQFLEKARRMYSKITGKGLRKERQGATQTLVAKGSVILKHLGIAMQK